MNTKLNFRQKLEAYHLKGQFYILLFLILITIASLVVYLVYPNKAVISNIMLAIFTSIMASIVAVGVDVYIQYKNMQKDRFVSDIHSFGIESLNMDKKTLLADYLRECDKTLWISGYRLILTDGLRNEIAQAVLRGAKVTAVLCPPWSPAYQTVYESNDKVMDNYIRVIHTIQDSTLGRNEHTVLFINKPLFSDTYRVDQRIVTGPYLHNKDPHYRRMMAKDFFSYIVATGSPMYKLIETEYKTLIEDADYSLDWDKFAEFYNDWEQGDYNEKEKRERFQELLIPIEKN